jgi:hypothetical protein
VNSDNENRADPQTQLMTELSAPFSADYYFPISIADSPDSYFDGVIEASRGQSRANGDNFASVRVISRFNSHTNTVGFFAESIQDGASVSLHVGELLGETWVFIQISPSLLAAFASGSFSGEEGQLDVVEASDITDLEPHNSQSANSVSFNFMQQTRVP